MRNTIKKGSYMVNFKKLIFINALIFLVFCIDAMEQQLVVKKVEPDPELWKNLDPELRKVIFCFLPSNHRFLNEIIRCESFPDWVKEKVQYGHIRNIMHRVREQRSTFVPTIAREDQDALLDKIKVFMNYIPPTENESIKTIQDVWSDLIALDYAIPHVDEPQSECSVCIKSIATPLLSLLLIKDCLKQYEHTTQEQLEKYFLENKPWQELDRDSQQDAQDYIIMRQYFLSLVASRLKAYQYYDPGYAHCVVPGAIGVAGVATTLLPQFLCGSLAGIFSLISCLSCSTAGMFAYIMCDICKHVHYLPNHNDNSYSVPELKKLINTTQQKIQLQSLLKKIQMDRFNT